MDQNHHLLWMATLVWKTKTLNQIKRIKNQKKAPQLKKMENQQRLKAIHPNIKHLSFTLVNSARTLIPSWLQELVATKSDFSISKLETFSARSLICQELC